MPILSEYRKSEMLLRVGYHERGADQPWKPSMPSTPQTAQQKKAMRQTMKIFTVTSICLVVYMAGGF